LTSKVNGLVKKVKNESNVPRLIEMKVVATQW